MATDRTFRSHTDASDEIHDVSCSPCSKEGKNTEALYHCMICHMFYCERCVDVHNKFTANHSLTYKTSDKFGHDSGKPPTYSSNEMPNDLCEEHHGEVVKMFCGQHDDVCCTICIAVNHRSCKGVEYIPNIASGLLSKHDREKIKHSLEKLKADLENRKSKINEDLQTLDAQREGIIADILTFKKRIIARVEEMERKSFEEVNSKYKELTDDLNAYKKKIDDILKHIDARLDKFSPSRKDSKAQMVVDLKKGEKELSVGKGLIEQITSRNIKAMSFDINTELEEHLNQEQSLGSLQEYNHIVNIVCPFDTATAVAFVSKLQRQLKCYNIGSKVIKPEKIVVGRYTIVVFENGSKEDMAVKKLSGTDDSLIILMNVIEKGQLPFAPSHRRKVKAKFRIGFSIDKESTISFEPEKNGEVYQAVSNIVNT